jgi:hypothetical protein
MPLEIIHSLLDITQLQAVYMQLRLDLTQLRQAELVWQSGRTPLQQETEVSH